MALIVFRRRNAEEVEDGWGGVHQADYASRADLITYEDGRCDHERHMDVFLVEEEGVAEVAVVLAERFAVVAEDDPDGFVFEAAGAHSFDQLAQRGVAIEEGVSVPGELVAIGEGSAVGSIVEMMTGDGQIGEEESLVARLRVDPGEHSGDGCGLVHAEAGLVISADIAGILERLVAAMVDDRLHAEISEAAGVEHRGAISGVR